MCTIKKKEKKKRKISLATFHPPLFTFTYSPLSPLISFFDESSFPKQRTIKIRKHVIYLYIKLRFLVKNLPLIPLTAQMIDAVFNVVVVLVVVLSWSGVDVVQPCIIGTALVFILCQICVR